jgi:hypothetical protein
MVKMVSILFHDVIVLAGTKRSVNPSIQPVTEAQVNPVAHGAFGISISSLTSETIIYSIGTEIVKKYLGKI